MTQTNFNGREFLDFIVLNEEELNQYHPIAGSFAVIKCKGEFLFCYNVFRKQWEIPVGRREGNESPKECAIREVYEETGQVISEMEFMGLMKINDSNKKLIKYNPVYFSEVEGLQPFIENVETSQIILWDLKEEIGKVDSVDRRVFDFLEIY